MLPYQKQYIKPVQRAATTSSLLQSQMDWATPLAQHSWASNKFS